RDRSKKRDRDRKNKLQSQTVNTGDNTLSQRWQQKQNAITEIVEGQNEQLDLKDLKDFKEYEKQNRQTSSCSSSLIEANKWKVVSPENTIRTSRRSFINKRKCHRQSELFIAVN